MKCRWALLLLGAGCMPARPDSTEAQAPLTELIQRLDREIRERRQSEEEKQSRDELRQELEREIESEFEMRLDPAERKLESMIARLSEAASERETRERRDAETHAKIQQTFGELEALAKKLGDAVETDRKERAQLERSVLRLGDRLRRQPAELDRKLDAMHETLASDFGETLRDEHSSFRQQLEQKLRRLEKVLKKSNEEGSTRDGALSEKIAALASSVQELSIELDENERSAKASRDAAKLEREALERTAATRSGELKTVSAELGKLGARVAAESERRRRAESELGGRLDALAEIVSHGLQTLEGRLERRASRMEDAAKDGSTEKSNRQELAKSRDENEEPAGPEAGKREPGPGSVLGGGPALEPDIWEHPLSLAAGGLVLLLLLYLLFRREELEPAGQAEPSQAVPEAASPVEPTASERAPEEPVLVPRVAAERRGGAASSRSTGPRGEEISAPSRAPAARNRGPRVQSLRVAEVIPGGDEAVRGLLGSDPRVLVEPAPRIERRSDGSLSIRFYALGSVDPLDLEAIAAACRALATRGEAAPESTESTPSVEPGRWAL